MSKILVARTPRTDRSKAKEGADDCEAIVSVNLKLTDYTTAYVNNANYRRKTILPWQFYSSIYLLCQTRFLTGT